MPSKKPLQRIRQALKSISNKCARIVIQHILKHGQITTEELEKTYGYNHPPRAARDAREAGIPLETFRVQSSDGRSIAAYRFGDLSQIRQARLQGRKTFPKTLKDELYALSKGRCAICRGYFEARYLQVDHRVPYEVAGDSPETTWSCEHCVNGQHDKLAKVCQTCYWANPQDYMHIALREVRRTDILWDTDEIEAYERLKQSALQNQVAIPDHVKEIIRKHLYEKSNEYNKPNS
jgi:hypothetical protein